MHKLLERNPETLQITNEWECHSTKMELLRQLGLEMAERSLRKRKWITPKSSGFQYKWKKVDELEEVKIIIPEVINAKEHKCHICGKSAEHKFRGYRLCDDCFEDDKIIVSLIGKAESSDTFKPLFNTSGIYKALFYGDCHFPYQDDESMSILFQILNDYDFQEILDFGDSIDGSILSEKFPNYEEEKYDLYAEMKIYEEHLRKIRKIKPNAKITILSDNHYTLRKQRFIANNPAMKNLIKEIDFNFDEEVPYGIPYLPLKEYGQNKLGAIHGYSATDFFTKKMTLEHPINIIQAHCHTHQVYYGKNKQKAYGLGCMCKLNLAYLFNTPSRWMNQLAVITYDSNSNNYALEFIDINNGVAIYRDKIYKGV